MPITINRDPAPASMGMAAALRAIEMERLRRTALEEAAHERRQRAWQAMQQQQMAQMGLAMSAGSGGRGGGGGGGMLRQGGRSAARLGGAEGAAQTYVGSAFGNPQLQFQGGVQSPEAERRKVISDYYRARGGLQGPAPVTPSQIYQQRLFGQTGGMVS